MNKPIIQQAQLTDENGVAAVTVATGGAVTFGTAAANIIHTIHGNSSNSDFGVLLVRNYNTSLGFPAANFRVGASGTTTGTTLVKFSLGDTNGSGQINANGFNSCAFGSYSDRRLKENITPISNELTKVLALNPVEFDYKTGGHQVGFIAQEIEQVYPDAVSYVGEETEEMKTVTGWDKTTARLVKAIQELSAKNDALEARMAALEAK